MPSARHWHAGQLAAAWVAIWSLVVFMRWALEAGVYEARIEGHQVTIVSGLWPMSFASVATVLALATALIALTWLTGTWIAGSRERNRLEAMTESPFRRPLI